MMDDLRISDRLSQVDDLDPLLCDNRIAQEYALFQFNNLATAIVGHAQLALNNSTYESLKRSAHLSSEYGQKMADMARSLLVFARGSAGETAQSSISELLTQVLKVVEGKRELQTVKITSSFHDTPPIRVDGGVVREVFMGLLTHATYRAPRDGNRSIHVSAEAAGNAVRVSLRYQGLTISRQAVDQICVPLFNPSSVAGTTHTEGACPSGSQVTVDVVPEDKDVLLVAVCIPCAPQFMEKRYARVLVVDDEPVILSIFSRFIKRAGHMVDTASGGAEALEKLRNTDYDVVLLDWMMPEVPGAAVLHEAATIHPDLPFVVVTAAYSRKVAAAAIDAGAVECIGKPLNHKKVLHLIEKYSGARQRAFSTEEDGSTQGKGEMLLVAEPEALTRDLYHVLFDHTGYECSLVTTGEEILAALEKEYYDAILINDALLRGLGYNGMKSLRRLNPYTPILIVGDHADDVQRQRMLTSGAAAFLEKPLEIDKFLRSLRAILDLYKEPSASRYSV